MWKLQNFTHLKKLNKNFVKSIFSIVNSIVTWLHVDLTKYLSSKSDFFLFSTLCILMQNRHRNSAIDSKLTEIYLAKQSFYVWKCTLKKKKIHLYMAWFWLLHRFISCSISIRLYLSILSSWSSLHFWKFVRNLDLVKKGHYPKKWVIVEVKHIFKNAIQYSFSISIYSVPILQSPWTA